MKGLSNNLLKESSKFTSKLHNTTLSDFPNLLKSLDTTLQKKPHNVKLFAIEGIIAAGKSTLLRTWKRHTSFKNTWIVPEPISAWKDVRNFDSFLPWNGRLLEHDELFDASIQESHEFNLLAAMYEKGSRWCYTFQQNKTFFKTSKKNVKKTWALQTQVISMQNAIDQIQKHQNKDETHVVLVERSIYSNYIFASIMRDNGDLDAKEWHMYRHNFHYFWQQFPRYDGILFLNTDVETAMNRLHVRQRSGEVTGVPKEYQEKLLDRHSILFNDCERYGHMPVLRIYEKGLNLKENEIHKKKTIGGIDSFIGNSQRHRIEFATFNTEAVAQ
ncbi:deoxycytidine kinase [Reticulomyxa filosa]|uniref:Deoxycytidine kinase n=1 Tax=Reticulomyxa filosa TaxID=46433 RepID=X6NCU5_RETFI|nr:deoxycytidine kinase [Reticulomyxa filosa]|eukprot:ETO23718.1 deoxycytidine kinase [Reticulomyxa filosa]